MVNKRVLYVRLPCWKIYPGGVIYVADYIHKHRPDVEQEILDLALVAKGRRKQALVERLRELKPDVVAFSWRNMQSFGPHPEDDALDVVMNFDHSRNPLTKIKAAKDAVSIIYDYASARLNNFSYMRTVRRMLPDTRVVVGGTAVSIFGEYVAQKCPQDSVVIVGEGEDAMLSVVDGAEDLEGEYYRKDHEGRVSHHRREQMFDLSTVTAVDFDYIQSIFPDFGSYLDDYIGVQTKRGCPYQCHFCLYNKIEGARQRYRDPVEIAKEVETLNKRFGVKKIWFTDAQFCSTRRSTRHVESILDELLVRHTDIQWSGYLRLNFVTPELAHKMLATGLCSLDLSFAGSQEIIDRLTLGYSLAQQMDAFRMFKENGYTDQKIKLYMPLNAPGETRETLLQTIDKIEELYAMFGRDNVLPFIFFIGVQPGTPVEQVLIDAGYLKKDYDPLTLNPFVIKRLLYNPPPLGRIIGEAYLQAVDMLGGTEDDEYIGRLTMELLGERLRGKGKGKQTEFPVRFRAARAPSSVSVGSSG
ncbi:MAG: radical SAM protein [Pseudomonadota bacterium]|nr:MAG: radical SAM protein [Pseudomonadota bacterium]